jgi:hypothetical protein
MEPNRQDTVVPKQRRGTLIAVCTSVLLLGVIGSAGARDADKTPAATKGESSQQVGQQGLGLDNPSSPILAGPETIMGSITKIHGDEYTIAGDAGQHIRIRVTKDTNKVCSSGTASVSSGQVGVREREEVPPTPYMQQRSRSNEISQQTQKRDRQDLEQHALSPPSSDPSSMQTTIGSTDARANEDVARGSGFRVGECAFKVGDQVRVESSDMGTATTIKHLSAARTQQ